MSPSIGPFKTKEEAKRALKSGKYVHNEINFERMGYTKPIFVEKARGWYIVFTRNGKENGFGIFGA